MNDLEQTALEKILKNTKWSRDVIEIRKLEDKYFQLKDYVKAEQFKTQRKQMQEIEMKKFDGCVQDKVEKHAKHLQAQQ